MKARRIMIAPFLLASLLAAVPARAAGADAAEQEAPRIDPSKERLSLGLDVHRFQDDFAVGGTLSSPSLARWFRFTLGGGVAWYPHGLSSSGDERWELFGHARFVVEAGPSLQTGMPVRPYGFGGTQALFLPTALTDNRVAFGGVGGFGLEVAFMRGQKSGPVTYYMEVGGAGFGARAGNLPTNPDVASGLFLGGGFRAYL